MPKLTKLTPEAVNDTIDSVKYYTQGALTICSMTLVNDFKIVESSCPIMEDNFDAEIGQKIAYKKCVDKIWELEGYRIKSELYQESLG